MVKFMVIFKKPAPARLADFELAYNQFLALVERMPNIQRRQVISVLGSTTGASPYYRILEIYFADQAQMHAALESGAGQEAGGELFKSFPLTAFETVFAEVYEEAGGHTETT